MELETVELIMAVEQEFRIEIPDDIAERIISVGQLSAVVQTEISRLHRQDEGAVFDRVAGIAAQFAGGTIVRPETRLIEDLGLK